MSYTPTTWADNDLITVQKLNKMEQGLKEQKNEVFLCILSVTYNSTSGGYDLVLDKTYAELKAAVIAGKQIIIQTIASEGTVIGPIIALQEETNLYVALVQSIQIAQLSATSDNTALRYDYQPMIPA